MVAAAAVLALAAASPLADVLTRIGMDLALPAARRIADPAVPPSQVALILIDETTHRTAPFDQTPEVAWTPYLATILDAVGDAGPTAIGLDLIYPKTLAFPDLAPGFDRPFLATLARLGRTGKLVLSEVRLSKTAIVPYPGQQIAVGGAANIRSVHLVQDVDNVVRRQNVRARREDGTVATTLVGELAVRAGARPSGGLIDFRPDPDRFAAYRLSDLYACAAAGRREAFAPFRGKVVLVGTALDVEDRHLAADRFAAHKTPPIRALPCGAGKAAAEPLRATTPGVVIAARALDTLLTGAAPRPLGPVTTFGVSLLLLLGLGGAFLSLSPLAGASLWGATSAGAWAAGVGGLGQQGLVLPWLSWILAAGLLLSAVHGYRVLIEGAARRRVTQAFGRYLSPALVNRLAEHPEQLKLGGEARRVSVMMADLEGFTGFAEQHEEDPEAVVARLNAIFAAVGDVVDRSGGYVDKFLGDGVMAIWGAPEAAGDPEAAAARTALACVEAVAALDGAPRLRVGLSVGPVIAGNIGSRQRFAYTVIGAAVNRAARLEELNKTYGTQILVDAEFLERLPAAFRTRRVGETTLRGMTKQIEVHELLGYGPAD